MNWSLPKYNYEEPKSIEEALSILEANPAATLKAGGTDLLVKMRRREIEPELIVNIRRMPGLNEVGLNKDHELVVGATTTITQLLQDARVAPWHGIMDAVHLMGTPQIRNLATVGGNICNRSPCADIAAALISYGAVANVVYPGDRESCPVEKLLTGGDSRPGIVAQINLSPLEERTEGAFLKYTATRGPGIAIVNCAITMTLDQSSSSCTDSKIIFGGVAPSLIRAQHAEEALKGGRLSEALFAKTCDAVQKDLFPITDFRASAEYRMHVSRLLLRQAFKIILERAGQKKNKGKKYEEKID